MQDPAVFSIAEKNMSVIASENIAVDNLERKNDEAILLRLYLVFETERLILKDFNTT